MQQVPAEKSHIPQTELAVKKGVYWGRGNTSSRHTDKKRSSMNQSRDSGSQEILSSHFDKAFLSYETLTPLYR